MVGEMLARIGKNLPAIFGRDVEPLDVMLKDDLLNKVYSDGLLAEPYPRMAKYFEALVFKKPHMKIVEVGAGNRRRNIVHPESSQSRRDTPS